MALTKIPSSLLDTSGGITLGDNDKAIFGAGSDLQIYHDGSHSYIDEVGTGRLYIRAQDNITFTNSAGSEIYANFGINSSVGLRYDNALKIATTSTGATVTGDLAVTGDLNITGNVNSASVTDLDVTDKTITLGAGQTEALSGGSGIIIDGSNASILWDETNDEWDFNKAINVITDSTGGFKIETAADAAAGVDLTTFQGSTNSNIRNFNIHSQNFTVSTGAPTGTSTTKALTIDNNQNVGIGTTAPQQLLDIKGTAPNIRFTDDRQITWSGTEKLGGVEWFTSDTSANGTLTGASIYCENSVSSTLPNFNMVFATQVHNNSSAPIERMRISSDGNVGIGINTPAQPLSVMKNSSTSNTTPIAVFDTQVADDYGIVEIDSGADNNYRPSTLRFKEGGNLKWEIGGTYQLVDDSFGIRNSSGDYKMVIQANGNVGINDTEPDELIAAKGTNCVLKLDGTATTGVASVQYADQGTVKWSAGISKNSSQSGANWSIFEDGASGSARFTVEDGGQVGIGTTAPTAPLDVSASIGSDIAQTSTHGYSSNRNWAMRTNNYGSSNWGGWSLERSSAAGGAPNKAYIGIHMNGNVGIGYGGSAGSGGWDGYNENPTARLHVGGDIKSTLQVKQGNSDGTPRYINIPFSSAGSGFSFNFEDLAEHPGVNDQTAESNSFIFEVNVTSYLFRYVKALIMIDTNATNSISVVTLHNSTLTCSATIPTNSEVITVTIGGLWGNAANYMGRITTF